MHIVNEEKRYRRHFILKEIGKDGQEKLRNSKILVIGAGGLGSPVLMYLCAAGIGKLGVVDFDTLDESNMQRQIIHRTELIGTPKVESAKKRLNEINPNCLVVSYNMKINEETLEKIIGEYDMVIDAVDNLETRYVLNKMCQMYNKPLIYGSIYNFEGQVMTIIPGKTACYECLFPHGHEKSREEIGVIGALPGIIGSLQALEAIKLIIGVKKVLSGRLLYFNGLNSTFKEFKIPVNKSCPVCGTKEKEAM